MRKEYASELTKDFLVKAGVKAVDFENCKVYGEQSEFIPTINAQGYLMIAVYELDENGNKTSEVNPEGKARRSKGKVLNLGEPRGFRILHMTN